MRYLFDTDPGIDDAIAIMLAIRNNLKVVGFTIATGNIEASKAENNLKIIEDFLNVNIPIYRGKHENKSNPETAEFAHGKDGLGYAVFPKSDRTTEKMYAENAIIKYANKYKDDLTIVCLGPLTNLANALRKKKSLSKKIKHVIIMGTSYDPKSSPYLEFNVKIDPEAANTVLTSGIEDIKLITHEIGVISYIDKEYVLNLRHSDDLISRFVGLISEKYIEFSYEHYHTVGLGTPDPTTVGALIDPKLIKYIPAKVEIVERNGINGYCKVKEQDKSNILVATDIDLTRWNKLFKSTFK